MRKSSLRLDDEVEDGDKNVITRYPYVLLTYLSCFDRKILNFTLFKSKSTKAIVSTIQKSP